MGTLWKQGRDTTAARRGQIIQCVLVDGWSPGQAATVFRVKERQVARWVAAYRRRGMASLRDDSAGEPLPLRWARRFHEVVEHALIGLPQRLDRPGPAPCVDLSRIVKENRRR